MAAPKEKEDDWLSAMSELVLKKDKLDSKDFVSWAAYHADRLSLVSQIALMPLFTKPAHTPSNSSSFVHLLTRRT